MRRKEIIPFVTTRMNLEDIVLSEISHSPKNHIMMWNLNKSNS